jgi:basic amino acid/polyamine antiporter, APA family
MEKHSTPPASSGPGSPGPVGSSIAIDYASPKSDGPDQLRRTVGRWQLLFYGLGGMLGAGIYALIGKAAGTMGNAVWMAFAAAMVAALLTGLSYASLGSRHPRAGGAAYITQRAFGLPLVSYVVGLAVMMSGLTSMATGSQAIANNVMRGYYQFVNPPAIPPKELVNGPTKPPLETRIPTPASLARESSLIKPLAIALVLVVGAILIKGIRESMLVNMLCTFVEAAGLLFIIAVGIQYWGSVNYLETPPPAPVVQADPSSATLPTTNPVADATPLLFLILGGAVLTFFSFIGFEDILNVSEEVKNPARDIPFGLIGAMLCATAIYMMVAITAVSVVPYQELGTSTTPLMDVAHRAAPWFGGIDVVFLVITIFSIGNTALLNYLMGSRLLYGMSRQGLLPAALGTVHQRTRTPVVAIGTLFVIVTILILAGGVQQLAESTVLLLLCVFVAMNAGLVILKLRPNEPKGQFEVPMIVPILGALVCAALIVSRIALPLLDAKEPEDAWKALRPVVLSAAILLIAGVLYFVVRPRQIGESGVIERD